MPWRSSRRTGQGPGASTWWSTRRTSIKSRAADGAAAGIQGILRVEVYDDFPGVLLSSTDYRNTGSGDLRLDRCGGGHFLLGAWNDARIVGAIGCERELRRKVQHIGHVIGMMVRPEVRGRGIGRDLLDACIAEARRTAGLEILTLTVTASNAPAIRLYESTGFAVYGNLRHALKIGSLYHDKLHMAFAL